MDATAMDTIVAKVTTAATVTTAGTATEAMGIITVGTVIGDMATGIAAVTSGPGKVQ
jgi:hypothetical protein